MADEAQAVTPETPEVGTPEEATSTEQTASKTSKQRSKARVPDATASYEVAPGIFRQDH